MGTTTAIVKKNKSFVLNVPRASQVQAVHAFGVISGSSMISFF
jgi:flavin reductase (DIM6/NTAB) family NADH-FMN oxidoreductase RutF